MRHPSTRTRFPQKSKPPLKFEVIFCVRGVISPLLANIYLNKLDRIWAARCSSLGILVRYADDFVAMCRTESQAKEALRRIGLVMNRLGLKLPPEKTRMVDLRRGKGSFVFLGCTIRKKRSIQRKPRMYYVQRWPSPKQSGSRKRRLPGRRRRHRQHWRRHTSWPATTHPECGARRSRLARGTSPGRARRLRSGRAAGHSAEDRPTCRRR
jgi:hypothetical protein